MSSSSDVIIGIDAGTSVIKAVAFDLHGHQLASSAVRNTYITGADGSATQSLNQTWSDCAKALKGLGEQIAQLADRTVAVGVTGQGDGTWLVGSGNKPVADAWLWLDARAAPTVKRLTQGDNERARFEATGTGLNTCQQGSQLAHMATTSAQLLEQAEVALHCKDWLFLNLTGVRASDPSEASFTFGDFRNRQYNDTVIDALGLSKYRSLLPEIVDGSQHTHALTEAAARQTGLHAGTPVSLGYVDMVMTALGGGVYTDQQGAACSTIGSTGVHMRAVATQDVLLNAEGTGYVICLPVPNLVTQVQTNMSATLNIDWALSLVTDIMATMGTPPTHAELVARIDSWMTQSQPGALLYHPYISEAGERGPFVNADARASLIGLNAAHRFPDLLRAVIEGLGMATRDCYSAMGELPEELRLSGGAARSSSLRRVLAATLNTRVRVSSREEAGAAGCAMMAAVAIRAYPDMDACIAQWTTPLLGEHESPDENLVSVYNRLFDSYSTSRRALAPVWNELAGNRTVRGT